MKKMTPLEYIKHRFPQFENVEPQELSNVIDGNTILLLMEEYYMYRKILERTSEDSDHYDYYH